MNRYLFKAKNFATGNWHKGFLVDVSGDKCTILENGSYWACNSETLCQCTSLKDKNGNLIWENDLVLTPREDGYSLICWNDTEARWEMHNETEGIVLDFDNYWSNEIEVVGNRFANPELMEVE